MTDRTPSQTVGPYLHIGLVPEKYGFRPVFTTTVAPQGQPGQHVHIEGQVFDGEGAPIADAMIEIWQADHEGRYAHPEDGRPLASNSFRGFGRASTETGGFVFETVKPGAVAGPNGAQQAPHITVGVFARGVLKRMHTRIYFPEEAANASDPILALVPADRRATLMAKPIAGKPGHYRFDIHLQGEAETVFFDA